MPIGAHRRRSEHDAVAARNPGATHHRTHTPPRGGLKMAQPRRLSRPDRPGKDSHPARLHRCPPFARVRSGAEWPRDDGTRIDPGRLIESAFRDRRPADDPETYVLAWLSVVGTSADVPRAAVALTERLSRLQLGVRSPWQRRLIKLLAFIAKHRRRSSAGGAGLRSITCAARKGLS
jgi:hypothetical protein